MKKVCWIALLPLVSCGQPSAIAPVVDGAILKFENRYSLAIDITSDGDTLYCVPIGQFSDFYGTTRIQLKSGRFAEKMALADKALYFVGGIDLAGGIEIVGRKKNEIIAELDNFELGDSDIEYVDMQFSYFRCSDIMKDEIPVKTKFLKFNKIEDYT